VLDEVNLSDYLGQIIKVRFQLITDNGVNLDGFYFDDFKVMYNIPGPTVIPVATFTATSTSICEGESVSFNDLSTNTPTSWQWNFGDGNSSILQSPSNTYSTAGNYTITLTATNSAGSNVSTLTNYITVQDCLSLEAIGINGFAILPNPNDGNFTLIGLEIGSEFDVFDMHGKLIKHATTEFQEQVINLDNVRSGIYYLQLVKNGQIRQVKMAIL
jgi:PKD repeat protein